MQHQGWGEMSNLFTHFIRHLATLCFKGLQSLTLCGVKEDNDKSVVQVFIKMFPF